MLSSYSAQSLAVLLHEFPDFRNVVKTPDHYFEIELFSPTGWPLLISSEGEELTVCFAEHHRHFTSFTDKGHLGGNPLDDAADAIDFLHQIFSGKRAVAVWSKNSSVSFSYSFDRQQGPVPTDFNRFSEWMWKRRMRNATLVVKQWSA